MYKQLEQQITLINNDLLIMNRRYGHRVNISMDQIELLRILKDHEVLSQFELTMKLGKEQSVVSRWIKKLVALGYIKRRQSKDDLRCNELILSDTSRAFINQINEARQQLIEVKCQNLTEEEQTDLLRLLHKLNHNTLRM